MLLVVMSRGAGYSQQSYKTATHFPIEWINKKWSAGFHITRSLAAGMMTSRQTDSNSASALNVVASRTPYQWVRIVARSAKVDVLLCVLHCHLCLSSRRLLSSLSWGNRVPHNHHTRGLVLGIITKSCLLPRLHTKRSQLQPGDMQCG